MFAALKNVPWSISVLTTVGKFVWIPASVNCVAGHFLLSVTAWYGQYQSGRVSK